MTHDATTPPVTIIPAQFHIGRLAQLVVDTAAEHRAEMAQQLSAETVTERIHHRRQARRAAIVYGSLSDAWRVLTGCSADAVLMTAEALTDAKPAHVSPF